MDANNELLKHQVGVFRTNCMDCLDRTNVVQSMLARRALQDQMQVRLLINSLIRLLNGAGLHVGSWLQLVLI